MSTSRGLGGYLVYATTLLLPLPLERDEITNMSNVLERGIGW